jgi:dipeptidyl aminopeptidase/acylaminoacyl peptidase
VAIAASHTSGLRAKRIESLLSARVFVEPQLGGGRIVFCSNLSGQLSLYVMDETGGVPEPLLPPRIALQNPELLGGHLFHVLPGLEQILLMIDSDGDENYLPHLIPLEGGFPEKLSDTFDGTRTHLVEVDDATDVAYFCVESRSEASIAAVRVSLATREAETLWSSRYGAFPVAWAPDHSRVVLSDGYTMGDSILYEVGSGERRVLYGTPIDEREPGSDVPLSGLRSGHGTASGKGVLLTTTLFDDAGSLGYLELDRPGSIEPVAIAGLAHAGVGELDRIQHLEGDRYIAHFNIDGCSWAYDGHFDEAALSFAVDRVLVGSGELAGGVLHGLDHDPASDRFAAAFCTATSPTQLYVLSSDDVTAPRQLTRERALGVSPETLSPGEDASFTSHDGLRVSARLYLPAPELGFEGPRPLAYYIHGGPQSQEQPNFAWFSMPLIQILTLEGFAVFVPNVRGSTGYGLEYSKRVDRDWGGLDRLDHVHAMTEVLPLDDRVDTSRAGVLGRSYGGYMTLTLAARHPELWRAAVDMFGPYDLFTFMDRLPETWKPYFALAVGDSEKDHDFLLERSPKTHIAGVTCPLLVIQGQNDPRVVERESRDVVEELRALGRDVDYLVFEDEGHDVLKRGNRVRCYDAIVGFFSEHLA